MVACSSSLHQAESNAFWSSTLHLATAHRPDTASNMPLTRTISARLRSGLQRKSLPTTADHQTEEVIALKAKAKTSASVDVSVVCRTLVAGTLAQLNLQDSSKGSSPSSSTSASTASTASRPRYMRGSGRFSSRSSNSSRRSILGSSEFGDSSDDENDNGGNTPRLGGCDSFSPATARPDDSNKENVAPFRCASQDLLDIEARDAQQEEAIRRTTTRSRRSSLMERQSFTTPSPTTHMRRLSRSSTTSDLSTTSGKLLDDYFSRLSLVKALHSRCCTESSLPAPGRWSMLDRWNVQLCRPFWMD